MTVIVLDAAEADLEEIFSHYETQRQGLGLDFVTEFRRAVDRILKYPHGWQAMDETYRRCRLSRFPYGIIYRVDEGEAEIVINSIIHLSRDPDEWRRRGR